ncbi:JAB domain-containing protein [Roseibium sediminis]|uniref:JAB domain-containing protein n=1 Tax=Roseibium sediminis TaxID=1775174 RepID=UPI00123D3A3F|nr:JAB domain-containing protein [Roseibium sediminis]
MHYRPVDKMVPAILSQDPAYIRNLQSVLDDPEGEKTHILLEVLLGLSQPASIAHQLSRQLIAEHSSLNAVVRTDRETLRLSGVDDEAIDTIHLVQAIRNLLEDQLDLCVERQLVDSRQRAITYFNTVTKGRNDDWTGLLLLDVKAGALGSHVFAKDEFPLNDDSPKALVEVCLDANASGLVLAVRRNEDKPTPAQNEVKNMKRFMDIGKSIGLTVHEFLLFGNDGVASHYDRLARPEKLHENLTQQDMVELVNAMKQYLPAT